VNPRTATVAEHIGKTVRTRRAEIGLSQESLADLAGIDRTYASQIERAIANPSLDVLCGLCQALNLSLRDLIGNH
jgi:transcriptional regulator with XRE-family HTH domain